VLEDEWIDVPSFTDAVVYNPLGAAPIYTATVTYVGFGATQQQPQVQFWGGTKLIVDDHVDYTFKDAPQEIKIKSGERNTRTMMKVADGGWKATIGYLIEQRRGDDALHLGMAAMVAEGGARNYAELLGWLTGSASPTAIASVLAAARDAAPDDEAIHLRHQEAMIRAGRRAEVIAEYRAYAQKRADSALALALRARLELPRDAKPVLEEGLRRFPNSPELLSRAGIVAHALGDDEQAATYFAGAIQSPSFASWADEFASALVATSRGKDALEQLRRATAAGSSDQLYLAMTEARLAALLGEAPRRRVDDELGRIWLKGWLGDPTAAADGKKYPVMNRTLEIERVFLTNPTRARELCAGATPLALANLQWSTALLLALESERLGDAATARELLQSIAMLDMRDALARYLFTGVLVPEAERFGRDTLGPLELVRSRVLAELGDPKAAELLESARSRDRLHGVLWNAATHWKAPAERTPLFIR
jgi:tetratricopeptide (TPR) repeat protein